MTMTSDRLRLPFLAVAQAQKETTHNEALALVDIAVQPVVQSIAPVLVPTNPAVGQCWIVGAAPIGDWTGEGGALAGWSAGGWRFVAPFEGMTVWSIADGLCARRAGSVWIVGQVTAATLVVGGQQVVGSRQASIPAPSGGATIDAQARAAVIAITAALHSHGLIA
ncbi:MAG: hypothetical protein JWL66_2937 [Sphingomonadales bacterium]|nr:hypothetical protein [Sphingomonadales bacterium]